VKLTGHGPILDAIWRNFERIGANEGEEVTYLESLDAQIYSTEDLDEAAKELVSFTIDDDLFPFLVDAPPRTLSGSVGPEESPEKEETEQETEQVGLGPSIELEWPSGYTGRAAALSEYIAQILAVDPDVMRFRHGLLGDPLQTLSRNEANKLVQSLASHFFPFGQFRKLCMPLRQQEIVLEEYGVVEENGRSLLRATISVKPPGVTETIERLPPLQDPLLTFVWPWAEPNRPQNFDVWPYSVLGELQRASVRLAQKHPWAVDLWLTRLNKPD
jgi:hypothetical protein